MTAREVEGLTVHYDTEARYLPAPSQGGAHGDGPLPDAPHDDSFAVFRIGDGLDGETAATNFKLVDWATISGGFTPPLEINTGYDPRK